MIPSLYDEILRALAAMPPTFDDLRIALEALLDSASYAAPEMASELRQRFNGVLLEYKKRKGGICS